MAINAVRVPLIQILIEDFGVMTVSTSVVVNQSVTFAAESSVSVDAARVTDGVLLIAAESGMAVAGNLKWIAEGDTAESWSPIAENDEVWTPVNDTSETWDAIADSSESWTSIVDNSETWQIAA